MGRHVRPAKKLAKVTNGAGGTCLGGHSLWSQPYDQLSLRCERLALMMPLNSLVRRPLEVLEVLAQVLTTAFETLSPAFPSDNSDNFLFLVETQFLGTT